MVNFESDETKQEREIDTKTREITELFHHAEGILKKFGKQSDNSSISEQTVRNNMQRSLAKKLQGLSMTFRTSQKVVVVVVVLSLIHCLMNAVVHHNHCRNIWDDYKRKSRVAVPSRLIS